MASEPVNLVTHVHEFWQHATTLPDGYPWLVWVCDCGEPGYSVPTDSQALGNVQGLKSRPGASCGPESASHDGITWL